MSTPLLKTKRFIPRRPVNNLSRPDLLKRLDANLEGKVTLVATPAGFGKTTLVSSWARQSKHPLAWVSLDAADNDPVLFWAYVISGLQATFSEGDFLEGVNLTQLPPIKTLLAFLINALTEIDDTVSLILDDYHVIDNSQIHADLTYLIDNQPPSLHLVLITRADPPLPFARLRGRGLLTEIRAKDLRFTVDEAATFLNGIMQLNLPTGYISALNKRTEGWIIGLQLAALSMQGRADKIDFVTAFSGGHHFILEYLTEEVLNRLPEAERSFLLQTAVINRFNAELCDQLVGINNSANLLEELQRQNLFIVPLDDEHKWFRYHHLFRDLLQNRLQREFSHEHIINLYQQASSWYHRKGVFDEAVKCALLAQDFESAADLIAQTASITMLHGQLITLLNWIAALPEDYLDTRPRLRFYQAWALSLGGQPKLAEEILVDTKSTLEALPASKENRALRGELAALLTGIITYSNDPARIITEAQEALALLTEDAPTPRARVHMACGTAYAYDDQLDLAIQNYVQARDLALKAKNPFLATSAIEMLAGMQIYHLGHLQVAEKYLQQVLDLGGTDDGGHQTFTGTAHILLAEINLENNNLDIAASYLAKGMELLQQGGIGYSLPFAHCADARLKIATGDNAGAVTALQLADQAAQAVPLMHIQIHNLACQVKLAIHLRDVDTASQWASGEIHATPDNLPVYLYEVQQIALARVYLAQGDWGKTTDILDHITHQAEAGGRMVQMIEICILKALAFEEQGQVPLAVEALKVALSAAAPAGFRRKFIEAGQSTRKLLQLAATENIQPQFVNELLAAFNGITPQSEALIQSSTAAPNQKSLVDPLTERECEVLKLIAAGCTNQQIADELVVSLNTVKKHTTHIYGKLDVQNRTEAANYARELGLV